MVCLKYYYNLMEAVGIKKQSMMGDPITSAQLWFLQHLNSGLASIAPARVSIF